jgi:hypothetical protein
LAGPMSLPEGDKRRYEELNEIICNIHFHCDMRVLDKNGDVVYHDYMTYREWLQRRNRLRTGKTR